MTLPYNDGLFQIMEQGETKQSEGASINQIERKANYR